MGIIDLLKDIPLSAVLREKLISLESEKVSLIKENELLKVSNSDKDEEIRNLKKKLDDCERNKPFPKVDRGEGGSWVKARRGG